MRLVPLPFIVHPLPFMASEVYCFSCNVLTPVCPCVVLQSGCMCSALGPYASTRCWRPTTSRWGNAHRSIVQHAVLAWASFKPAVDVPSSNHTYMRLGEHVLKLPGAAAHTMHRL